MMYLPQRNAQPARMAVTGERETHHSVERMQRPDQHCMRMEMLFLLRSSPASKNARPGVILGTARQPARVI